MSLVTSAATFITAASNCRCPLLPSSARRSAGWFASAACARADFPRRRECPSISKTEVIEEFQLSFVNDHLALVQFDEGVVIQGVNYVVPALLKPERESARQLGIDQEPHAAKGTMR